MFFKRYYLGCLAHASYLIGDPEKGIAAVVDPQRDIDQYIEDAKAEGLEIRYVLLTHFHADFVAGHIELRDRLGAKIYLGESAQAEYDFTAVRDRDVIEFGSVRLSILETPGHTPEGISILVFDLNKDDRNPHAVLTGDTLFIGDVGRPDLLASIGVTADELADMLYDSLHEKLMKLPDETLVYPAHGAGSMCGKQLSKEAVSTIGDQRKYNYAVQPMSKADFKALVTADQPAAPDYFVHDAILNRQDRPALDESMQQAKKPLSLEQVIELQREGAQVLDVRDGVSFAGAHLSGSINISLDGKYATWCGTLLKKDRPIVIVGEHEQVEEAIMRLGRIGFDQVSGYLDGGPEALQGHPELQGVIHRVTAKALHDQMEGIPPLILDVRTNQEWAEGHVPGSVNIPLPQLEQRVGELPPDTPVAVHCKSGYRSSAATSLLLQLGRQHVVDVVGGMDAWNASKLPVEPAA